MLGICRSKRNTPSTTIAKAKALDMIRRRFVQDSFKIHTETVFTVVTPSKVLDHKMV